MLFPRARQRYKIALVILAVWGSCAHAAGLGPIVVQSGLGQRLRAHIPLFGTGAKDEDGSYCIDAKVQSLDGVLKLIPEIRLTRTPQSEVINLITSQNINELVLNVSVTIGCQVSLHRDYQILLDPVLSLPLPQTSPQLATIASPAQDGVQAAPGGDSHSGAHGHRSRKHRTSDTDQASPGQSPASDGEAVREPSKKGGLKKSKKISRSVLKLSSDDAPVENGDMALGLKMSNSLSLSSANSDPEKLAAVRAEQARLAALLRDESPDGDAEARLKAMQVEVEALRAETARIKKQNQQSDKAPADAGRGELVHWVGILAAILLVCVAAIAWLLRRLYTIKKNDARTSWERLMSGHEAASDFVPLDDTTDFDTADFSDADLEHSTTLPSLHTSSGLYRYEPDAITVQPDFPAKPSPVLPEKKEEPPPPPKKEEAPPPPPPVKYTSSRTISNEPLTRSQTVRVAEEDHSLKVEEISDVMQLAEIWMALHDPMRVLEILEPFKDVEQPESPLPWICLLDVYRAIGDQEKYNAIQQRIKRLYNVKSALWDSDSDEPPRTLADYPHIVKTIISLWEGDDVLPYLETLVHDNRDGTRDGFDLPVYRNIMQLIALAKDPARLRRIDQIMHDPAYAILFNPQAQEVSAAKGTKPPAGESAAAAAIRKQKLRDRPKYVTTSYQRDVVVGANAKADQAAPAANGPQASKAPAAPVPATVPGTKQPGVSVAGSAAAPAQAVAKSAPQPVKAAEAAVASNQSEPVPHAMDYDDMSPMSIKLHLAIAYQDIGDKEGAFLLLDEVIKEGTAEQSEEAKQMLAKLV